VKNYFFLLLLTGAIIFSGYWFDFRGNMVLLKTLNQKNKALQNKYSAENAFLKNNSAMCTVASKMVVLDKNAIDIEGLSSNLVKMVKHHDLSLLFFRPSGVQTYKQIPFVAFSLKVEGELSAVKFFIKNLQKRAMPIVLQDFSVEIQDGGVVTFWANAKIFLMTIDHYVIEKNPASSIFILGKHEISQKEFMQRKLKAVGLIKQGKTQYRLAKLPAGDVVTIEEKV